MLGDLGATLLVAWLATAMAALLVLFLRTLPSLVHDVTTPFREVSHAGRPERC
jgi:hypothetical protein